MKRHLIAASLLLAISVPALAAGQQERVYVQFAPGKAQALREQIGREGGKIHYQFDDLSTLVVTLPKAAITRLQQNRDVLLVEEDVKRYPMATQTTPWGVKSVQATKVWDANGDGVVDAGAPTGAGVTLCIIDSGIDGDHPDLQGLNIIGGTPSNYNIDNCSHGTHVAGTIAGVNNGIGVVGVSPGAVSLYFVKVFGDDVSTSCAWSYSSTLVNAGQMCVANGAKVISMSLGGGRKSKTEETFFNKAASKGVLPVAAAGNDGTTGYSYPASYSSVMSVGAIDKNLVIADFSQQNDQVDVVAPGVDVYSTVSHKFQGSLTVAKVSYAANALENSAVASISGAMVDGGQCLETGPWAGLVVLCQRGTITFAEKVTFAQNSGAIGVIIYNNVSGGFSGTMGEDVFATVPVVTISMEDGALLVPQVGTTAKEAVKIVENTYDYYNGTSMATPHVSAAAAVLLSANPSYTAAQVRSALESTALDLGTPGVDNAYGHGEIQMKKALNQLSGQ
ncbi:S8 family serine peptidase [Hydrocarboniphaga sp.]|uniref:S8 family serine peptidase n=1 Tax=Hydrocarboniphaga sp. TaxID=2033016 RepID=UPI003D13111E